MALARARELRTRYQFPWNRNMFNQDLQSFYLYKRSVSTNEICSTVTATIPFFTYSACAMPFRMSSSLSSSDLALKALRRRGRK